jgi:hypothetical protein
MYNEQFIKYVKDSLAAGHSEEEITKALLNAGHGIDDIKQLFLIVKNFQKPVDVQTPVFKKKMPFYLKIILGVVLLIFFGGYFENAIYYLVYAPRIISSTLQSMKPTAQEESRDIRRMNDLSTLSTAISLLQATTNKNLPCASDKVYKSTEGTAAVDGTGWLPVDFTKMDGGSPISALYVDPVNNSEYFYSYACGFVENKYELNANFESERFLKNNSGVSAINDRGDNSNAYETGSDLNLIK